MCVLYIHTTNNSVGLIWWGFDKKDMKSILSQVHSTVTLQFVPVVVNLLKLPPPQMRQTDDRRICYVNSRAAMLAFG